VILRQQVEGPWIVRPIRVDLVPFSASVGVSLLLVGNVRLKCRRAERFVAFGGKRTPQRARSERFATFGGKRTSQRLAKIDSINSVPQRSNAVSFAGSPGVVGLTGRGTSTDPTASLTTLLG
jgi:hypothetical protein